MSGKRIAITGSSGLIGGALSSCLRRRGDEVVRLVRRTPVPPLEARLSAHHDAREAADLFSGVDVVVNLAGAGIGDHRWTSAYKTELRRSRLTTTETLVTALLHTNRPLHLVSASAIGFYGDRGEEILTEASSGGSGFLADLVNDWETAALRARSAGHSVALARTGLVVSADGGALARMAWPTRLGLSGALGDGSQWWSWITLRDEVRALVHLIDHPDLVGRVNLTAPLPSRQLEVSRSFARAWRRPAVTRLPRPLLHAALGEMSGELTASARVRPRVLQEHGFEWRDTNLDQTLDRLVADLTHSPSR